MALGSGVDSPEPLACGVEGPVDVFDAATPLSYDRRPQISVNGENMNVKRRLETWMKTEHKLDLPRPPIMRAFAFFLVLIPIASACSSSEVSEPGAPTTECIASPQEWKENWDKRTQKCVEPWLFGTVIFPPQNRTVADGYLYPCVQGNPCESGFRYAWAFSSTNLELALELNHRYYEDPTKVSAAIFTLVGFTGIETFDAQVNLGVYTLPEGENPQVPTWGTWFRMLDELAAETASLQAFYSSKEIESRLLRAQQQLVYEYSMSSGDSSKYGDSPRQQDFVDVYNELSGCPRNVLITAPHSAYLGLGVAPFYPTQQCSKDSQACWDTFDKYCTTGPIYEEYKKFLVEADLRSPYAIGDPGLPPGPPPDSKHCFINALKYLQGHRDMISATTLRAMLAQCQDASELNTGAGLGYNTYPNPTSYGDECGAYWDPEPRPNEQTVLERLTGREYIVLNRKLKDHPEYVYVPLEFSDKRRPYLVEGYCKQDD